MSFAAISNGAASEAMERFSQLTGDWRGALSYLDYGSGEREQIGMASTVEMSPDGVYLITRSRFTDPGFDVFIMSVATIDEEIEALKESYHRDGVIQLYQYNLRGVRDTASGWVYVFEDEGEDDGRPALIRRTFTYNGDVFSQRKEVDFLDDDEEDFIFRNETLLRRSDDPVSFDDFRKQ